jgi:hypothetical protein
VREARVRLRPGPLPALTLFFVTLSDAIEHFGLEHHESSDNRMSERALIEGSGPHGPTRCS